MYCMPQGSCVQPLGTGGGLGGPGGGEFEWWDGDGRARLRSERLFRRAPESGLHTSEVLPGMSAARILPGSLAPIFAVTFRLKALGLTTQATGHRVCSLLSPLTVIGSIQIALGLKHCYAAGTLRTTILRVYTTAADLRKSSFHWPRTQQKYTPRQNVVVTMKLLTPLLCFIVAGAILTRVSRQRMEL